MKKFLYKNRILLFSLAIPYIIIILLCFIKVEYDVTVPAQISSIENVIEVEDETKLNGSINVVSVYSYERVSVLSYLIGSINPYANVSKSYEYTDIDYQDMYNGGVIDKRVSIYNSIIAGYRLAGYDIKYSFLGYIVDTITTYVDSDLEIGDIIVGINGKKLSNEYSVKDAISEANSSVLTMDIIKNGNNLSEPYEISAKLFEEDGKKWYSFGFNVQAYNIPTNSNLYPEFNILWKNVNSIGPSGGLLQAFYVYEKLTGAKLSDGLKISGTGTIDIDGNAGLIGGIEQKIITSELCGVDIFFIPVTSSDYLNNPDEVNYIDALTAYNKLNNPNMVIAPVWSLESLISAIKLYRGE